MNIDCFGYDPTAAGWQQPMGDVSFLSRFGLCFFALLLATHLEGVELPSLDILLPLDVYKGETRFSVARLVAN